MQLMALLVVYVKFISLMVALFMLCLYTFSRFCFYISLNSLLSSTINVMFDISLECEFAPLCSLYIILRKTFYWILSVILCKDLTVMYQQYCSLLQHMRLRTALIAHPMYIRFLRMTVC